MVFCALRPEQRTANEDFDKNRADINNGGFRSRSGTFRGRSTGRKDRQLSQVKITGLELQTGANEIEHSASGVVIRRSEDQDCCVDPFTAVNALRWYAVLKLIETQIRSRQQLR